MKKIFLPLLLLFFVLKMFGQAEKNEAFSKDYYLKKSKNQKTTAFILFGTGTTMLIATVIRSRRSGEVDLGLWGGLLLTGIVADLTSIPFFISSSKNKKKAAAIAVTNQKILWRQRNNATFVSQPSITIKVGL